MVDFSGDFYRFVLICELTGMEFRLYRDICANRITAKRLKQVLQEYKRLKKDEQTGFRLVLLRRRAIPKRAKRQFRDAWH